MDFIKTVPLLPGFKVLKNEACKNHTIKTIEHLLQGSPWALKMFDSSTKIPEGVLAGYFIQFGEFEECLEVNVEEEWGSFKGQHCLVQTNVDLSGNRTKDISVPFVWAVCLPSSCAATDITDFLSDAFNFPVNVDPLLCHIKEARPFTSLDWLAIGILSFFGLLCLLSTAYDLIVSDPRSRRDILLIFSWYKNGKQLLSTKRSANTLECLHGIRFLSIAWVVLGHGRLLTSYSSQHNIFNILEYIGKWEQLVFTGAMLAVDTCLTISGVLLCYVFMVTITEYRNFNFIIYSLHRYMRTTPLIAALVLIYLSLILHFGSGPVWDMFITSNCKQTWWATLLHVQNYAINYSEMCIGESWYISVDMQLYLFSPVILLPLLKRPKFGLILLEVVTTISIISCFLQLYLDPSSKEEFQPQTYVYTHTRATPWFVGMNLGYCLFRSTEWRKDVLANRRSGLSKKIVCAGWLLAFVCLTVSIFVKQKMYHDQSQASLEMAVSETLERLVWPLGISWIIFACLSGYGGPVNAFLSWSFFIPLGRLTYSVYLLHLFCMRIYVFTARSAIKNEDMETIKLTFASLLLATLLAIPVSLTLEFPVTRLQNLLFDSYGKKQNNIQPELRTASHREERMHNVLVPGAGMILDPGLQQGTECSTKL